MQASSEADARERDDIASSLGMLRTDAVRMAAWSLLALAVLLNAAMLFWKGVPPQAWAIVPAFAFTTLLTLRALSLGDRLGALCLVVGFGASLTLAVRLFPGVPLVCALPAVVLFAGAFIDWRIGAVTAVGISGLILGLASTDGSGVSPELAGVAILLSWHNVLASWLISRPLQVALEWWRHSYMQALHALEEARVRQGELGRLSKSLNETCDKLEQANRELAYARDAAEEARRLKSQFAAAVSHELRTPLNLIIGFSEMMVVSPGSSYGSPLPECYAEDVEVIYRNACHISALIDDILDLSQVEARRMGLQKQRVSLAEIVAQVVSSIGAQFENRGLYLRASLPDDLPCIHADPTRIRQILINLLVNSLRFTDVGGVTVRAEIDADGHEVIVSVEDTGAGIASADVPHVFDEFRQSGDPERRRGGSGLGLAVTRQFVELHGGSIWVKSQLGGGSIFYFSLPLADTVIASPYASQPVVGSTSSGRALNGKAVVVLEKDGDTGRIVGRYLDDYQVVWAKTIEQALRISRSRPISAVLTGSSELAERCGQQMSAEGGRRLPIAVCSLHSAQSMREYGNVACHLPKPVTPEKLRAALHELRGKTGRRAMSNIVVADDEPEMLRLLERMLHSWSRRCQVRTARDGIECLRAMREQKPDLLLLDLLMPEVDGFAVLEQMRSDKDLAEVPVAVISAWEDHDETVLASNIAISRPGGLSVGEAIRCLKSSLDALAN